MTVSTRREKEQWKSDLRTIFASLLFTKLRRMKWYPDLITVIFRCVAGLSRAQTTYAQNKIFQIFYQPLVSSVYIY